MSHERSITVGINGSHYNIRTVYGGKTLTNKEATRRAIKNKTLGKGFKTLRDAIKAAKKRSKSFDK